MKKILKIFIVFITIIILFIVVIQFFGFSIGNVQIGKSKSNMKTQQISSLDRSTFNQNYLNNGDLICINVWATWCKPCIEEMPDLNIVMKELADKNVSFVSISTDTDSLKLRKFIDSGKFNFVDITFSDISYRKAIFNYLEGKPLNYNGNDQVLPVTYLIKNKKVIERIEGGTDKEELKKLINKNL